MMFIQSESVRYATQVSHISSLYEPEVFSDGVWMITGEWRYDSVIFRQRPCILDAKPFQGGVISIWK